MGNQSRSLSSHGEGSRFSHSNGDGSSLFPIERDGGFLDPRKQIQVIYEKLISENKAVKKELKNTFQQARILVLGRSGCGKTTLIRALVGDTGPHGIVEGNVGRQDITTEWRHPDPSLPLIIHDSNGIDTDSNSRIADIRKFLDDRLAHLLTKEFRERVHAVWYVFSAMDNRVLDDGGLMEMLDGYGKDLPLLLIMTNNDYVEKLGEDEVKVNGKVLEKLLKKVKDSEKRKMLKEAMVKVGNKEGSTKDKEGMEMVFRRTKELMHRKLWSTWIACQVVDIDAKIQESSKLIVNTRMKHVWVSTAFGSLPIVQQIELATIFGMVTHGLAKIWNVPDTLELAIVSKFLAEERSHAVTKNFASNILWAVVLGGAVAATVVTGGIAAPSLLVAPALAAASQIEVTSNLIMSYSLLVLGSIIYVRAQEMISGDQLYSGTFEEYLDLCEEFVNSEWVHRLSEFSTRKRSTWDAAFREKRQAKCLRSHIAKFFQQIMSMRPSRTFRQMSMLPMATSLYRQNAADHDNNDGTSQSVPVSHTADVINIDPDRGQEEDED